LLFVDAKRAFGVASCSRAEPSPGVPHGFQAFAAILDEGDAALAGGAAFLDHHLSWAEATTS
jgi:hypothetical protein